MKTDLDILAVSIQLVGELGEGAVRLSRARLVEFIAADNHRAAGFWREVALHTERLCQEKTWSMTGTHDHFGYGSGTAISACGPMGPPSGTTSTA